MRQWIWVEGRFSWPFVVAVLYMAIFLLVADYLWRTLSLPFETFAILAFIVFTVGAVVIIVTCCIRTSHER